MFLERPHWSHRRPRTAEFLLDRNENCDIILREFIQKEFLPRLNADLIIKYPEIDRAYRAISELLEVDSRTLFLVSGSEQGIWSVMHRFRQDTNSLLLPDPTFGIVEVYANMYGYKTTKVPYFYDGTGFHLNSIELRKGGGIFYLASPDNPTGTVFDLDYLAELCDLYDIVILDQAYVEYEGTEALDLLKENENLFVVRTFSKAGAAAGLRIGYILSSETNINKLYEFRPMYELDSVACEFIEFRLKEKEEFESSATRLKDAKFRLESALRENGYTVVKCSGNFVLTEYNEDLEARLMDRVDHKQFTIGSQRFIRITSTNMPGLIDLV